MKHLHILSQFHAENISRIKEMHPKFQLNERYFLGRHFRSYM